jgi:hypothetical protein
MLGEHGRQAGMSRGGDPRGLLVAEAIGVERVDDDLLEAAPNLPLTKRSGLMPRAAAAARR